MGLSLSCKVEAWAIGCGLGLALLSLFVLCLSLLGRAKASDIHLLLLVFALFSGWSWRASWTKKAPPSKYGEGRDESLLSLTAFENGTLHFLIFFALIVAFVQCHSPPVAFDALSYHLTVPKATLSTGRLAASPHILHSGFPFAQEMLFVVAFSLGSEGLAALTHFVFLPLLLILVFCEMRRLANEAVALRAVAAISTMPAILWLSTWAYVDLAASFYLAVAVVGLLRAEGRWPLMAALMAGHAVGHKYTMVLYVLLNFLPASFMVAKNKKIALPTLALCIFVGVLVFSPWLLKNVLLFENPVFPFGQSLFPAEPSVANHYACWQETLRNWNFQSPWRVVEKLFFGFMETFSATTPLVLFYFVLLLLAFWQGPKALKLLFVLFLVNLIWWTLWFGLIRFHIPFLIFYFAGGSWALSSLAKRSDSWRRILLTVNGLGLLMALCCALFVAPMVENGLALLGEESRSAAAKKQPLIGGLVQMGQLIEHKLPKDAKVLSLWDDRYFYLGQKVLWDHFWPALQMKSQDEIDAAFKLWLAQMLKGQGVSHLYVSWEHRQVWARTSATMSKEVIKQLQAQGALKLLSQYRRQGQKEPDSQLFAIEPAKL